MTFQYPYAFLALLAIPVLILIYILKNKYKEETAPSTYLWELSQKFLKKRNPFHNVEHLLALIVQLATIAMLAVCLAHPVITLKNQADNMVFVLDSTASMKFVIKDGENKGKTKFEVAKAQILEEAKKAKKGSTFTLIGSSHEPEIVCQRVKDVTQFEMYLDSATCTDSTDVLSEAVAVAQRFATEGETSERANVCFLATDKKFEQKKDEAGNVVENAYVGLNNINLIDVSTNDVNYAITSLSVGEENEGSLPINGTLYSSVDKKDLKVRLYVDNQSVKTMSFEVKAGADYAFTIPLENDDGAYNSFDSIKAVITDKDSFEQDNTWILYENDTTVERKILLVSDTPFYFKSVFKALGSANVVTNIKNSAYSSTYASGYDIYVFDGKTPDPMPKDGAVWLFGISEATDDMGFRVSGQKYSPETDDPSERDGYVVAYADNVQSDLYNNLTLATAHNETLVVNSYYRYSNLSSNFTTILNVNPNLGNQLDRADANVPVLFAGKNELGQRQIVSAFSLSNSNLQLTYDFVALIRNFLNYSKPITLSDFEYTVNEQAMLAIGNDVESVTVSKPDGESAPLVASDDGYITYDLTEAGTYKFTTVEKGKKTDISVFVSYPKEEANPAEENVETYNLTISDTVKGNGIFDNILPIVIVASILFGTDWILYAHEQY